MTSLNDLKKSIEKNIERIILAFNTEKLLNETINQLKLDIAHLNINGEIMADKIFQLTGQNEALNSILNKATAANLEFRRENDHVKSLMQGIGLKKWMYECGNKRRLDFEIHFNKMVCGLSGTDDFDILEMDFDEVVKLFNQMKRFSQLKLSDNEENEDSDKIK